MATSTDSFPGTLPFRCTHRHVLASTLPSFNISVNFSIRMKILQSFQGVVTYERNLRFCHCTLANFHEIRHRPGTAIFHHDLVCDDYNTQRMYKLRLFKTETDYPGKLHVDNTLTHKLFSFNHDP